MIKSCACTNLKDLLTLYVPNMTAVEDQNEMNVAMRGVYASSQQKILFLLNGHRLNSRSYSSANPDFSHSLDKIERIEILRGAASSLYGNVALTAVINIITKNTDKISLAKATTSFGNNGQQRYSALFMNKIGYGKLLVWGNFYQAEGEKRNITKQNDYARIPQDGTIILGGAKDKPSYDFGINYSYKNLSILANLRNAKYVEPFSGGAASGEVYAYDKYRTFLGVAPGLNENQGRLRVGYDIHLNEKVLLHTNAYADYTDLDVYIVTAPATGRSNFVAWKEYDLGNITQISKHYDTFLGKGNWLAGTQVDYVNIYDSFWLLGNNFEFTSVNDNNKQKLLETGSETIFSGFGQVKQEIGKNWVANIGLRYDYKRRHRGEVSAFSPRFALIFKPNTTFSLKFSYATSFIDAPYWYRYNRLPSYLGSSNLLPEEYKSFQINPTLYLMQQKLVVNFNLFYNQLSNNIFRNLGAKDNEPRYNNAGTFNSAGAETEIAWTGKTLRTNFTIAYQKALKIENYTAQEDKVYNVPNVSANLMVDVNPFGKITNKFWIGGTLRYIGEQLSPIAPYFKNGQAFQDPNFMVQAATIVGMSARIEKIYGFSLQVQISNLLETNYLQGGSTRFAYPQQGRWYNLTLSYEFLK
jgi:iron complex outermembrane receptor protein